MLEFAIDHKNNWNPPEISDDDLLHICENVISNDLNEDKEYLIISQVEPFIDTLYVHYTDGDTVNSMYKKRFVFNDDYHWNFDDERFFVDNILKNKRLS